MAFVRYCFGCLLNWLVLIHRFWWCCVILLCLLFWLLRLFLVGFYYVVVLLSLYDNLVYVLEYLLLCGVCCVEFYFGFSLI